MAVTGLWLSVVTTSYVGSGAVLLVLFILIDLSEPLPTDLERILKVDRLTKKRVSVGEPVSVKLEITNTGPDIRRLYLADHPPARARIDKGSSSMVCSLKHGSKLSLQYEIVFKEAGEYRFQDCSVRVSSLFSLADEAFVLAAPSKLRVYPKLLVPRLDTMRARAFGWAGTTPSTQKGGRLEFANIRRYLPGDKIKDVNWRASARLGKLLVNEWQAERGVDSVIIVDLFSDDLPRAGNWSAREEVVEATYELACSLTSSGNRVGMLVMGNLLYKVRPGFGIQNLRAMVEGLIASEEGQVWNVRYAEEFLEGFFREQYSERRGTLFFVSAGTKMRLLAAIRSLSAKGFVCSAIMVNSLKEQGLALTERGEISDGEAALGLRLARAELDWFETELARFSDVFEWDHERGIVEARGRRK